nr:arsenic metallochaperone ArsD family protein [Tessaracoccus coleopterorum]
MRLVVADIAARVEALHTELTAGPRIRVFEPALCCNTGVCGTDVDEALVSFTADLDHLRRQGVDIERANLANDPGAFASNKVVADFLRVAGSAGLPSCWSTT